MILGNAIKTNNRQERLRQIERCQKRHAESRYIIKMQDVFAEEQKAKKLTKRLLILFFIGLPR